MSNLTKKWLTVAGCCLSGVYVDGSGLCLGCAWNVGKARAATLAINGVAALVGFIVYSMLISSVKIRIEGLFCSSSAALPT